MIHPSAPRGLRITAVLLALASLGAILIHAHRLASGEAEPGILSLGALFAGLYLSAWLGHFGLFGCRPGRIKR